jgi:putative transposase
LKSSVTERLLGSTCHRCKVHFFRSILVQVGCKAKVRVAEEPEQIRNQPNIKDRVAVGRAVPRESADWFSEAVGLLQEGLEDSLQPFTFPKFNSKWIASTNTQAHLPEEVCRRSRVVGIFPSVDSYLRLVSEYKIEFSDDRATSRAEILSEETHYPEAERTEAACHPLLHDG